MYKTFFLSLLLLLFAYFIISQENIKIILSGIAIFLMGMHFMEEGFRLFSGGFLQKVLKKFTNNLFKAITTGFIATSIVQSSSLISVIVISFLSVELLSLSQAIGIIFGSNLGSTTTAWIVSAFGLKIKISTYAMPMIIFGVLFRFFKNKTYKGLGNILLGLGFIFLGISYMKEGFDTLKDSIDLASYALTGTKGILLYTLIGAIATIIIQSSSATMAIIITALSAGNIIYINALALAIGSNIGTTVTAIIGSLASNIEGKRLAFAHFIFNIITALITIIFIYSLKDFVDILASYLGINSEDYTIKLALFHTVFNLLGIILVAPFINVIVNLAKKFLVDKKAKNSKPKYLLKANIKVPDTSIISVKNECKNLYNNCQKAIFHAIMLHTSKLNKYEDLDKELNSFYKIDTNLDEIYHHEIKLLYAEIIDFSSQAQEYMNNEQQNYIADLKRGVRILIEVLKDTRDFQKNLIYYLNSDNKAIKQEYNFLRKELAKSLFKVNEISKLNDDLEKSTQLEVLKSKIKISTKKVDRLIRTHEIDSLMATSLINDSVTVRKMQFKLVEIAYTLFVEEELLKQLGENDVT